MMKSAAGVLALMIAATPALALDFTGGTVTLGYSALSDDGDLSKAGVAGQFEFGLTPQFGVQGDVGVTKFFDIGETMHDLTVHGIYHTNPNVAMGVFYGAESGVGDTQRFYGFEVAQHSTPISAELYLGRADRSDLDGMIGGLSGRYALTPDFGVGLAYDRADLEHQDLSRVALQADYAVLPNLKLGGEIGSFDGDTDTLSGRETYIGLNAEFTFGRQGDTTFGRRGVLNLIPGL
ncbi:hypothetical protein [Falsirhodobacter sp. alg1]|uniref:hypothetical protein n=1 Tax=Falsirhodobacter sp. alg1 TaxID=1472418 RepID=UPI0005EFA369|nr:hypothetical protein [Falsirhodobacter sp. alg1]